MPWHAAFPEGHDGQSALAAPLRCGSATIYRNQSDGQPGSNMTNLAHKQVGEISMREETPFKSKSCTKPLHKTCSGRTIRVTHSYDALIQI
jgi:hypothetical protein